MQLKIAKILAPVYSLGSGKRLAIWTQGCKQGCVGCISLEFQPLEEGCIYPIESLVSKARFLIRNLNIIGISISGGEPMQTDWLDILIDGEYLNWETGKRFLRGSKNQRILFFSELGIERFYPYYKENKGKRPMQIFNDESGIFLTGVPDKLIT